MKANHKPATPTGPGNIIQFALPEPTWMKQAKRLHDDGHKEFASACMAAEVKAMFVGVRRDSSLEALFENMETLKRNSRYLTSAINEIEEAYNKAYHHECKIIPFKKGVNYGR